MMKRIFTILILMVLSVSSLFALTTTWNGATWDLGAPTSADVAIIAGAYNSSTDGGSITASDITINSGITLTISSGDLLTLTNTITNNGDIAVSGNGAYTDGVSATDVSISSTGTITLNAAAKLTVTNTIANSGSIIITGDGSLSDGVSTANVTVSQPGTVTINPLGKLNASGNISINSVVSGDGSLINHGTVSGNAVVHRYLPGTSWHLISSSVTSATSSAYTGLYMRQYDETTNVFGSYITSTTLPLSPGTGALLWATGATTIAYNGLFNDGAQVGPLTCTDNNQGFNLMGNPYPSAIDWNAAGWTKTNLLGTIGTIWVWSQVAGNYAIWDADAPLSTLGGSQYIAMGQGFFVQALAGAGSLTMTKSVQVHNSVSLLKSATVEPQLIRAKVVGNKFSDEAVVLQVPDALSVIDYKYDAQKIIGLPQAPQLYTLKQNKKFSIYSLSKVDSTLQIPLYLNVGKDTSYTLTLQNSIALNGLKFYLKDNKTKTTSEVKVNFSYKFNATPADDSSRFVLIFKSNVVNAVNALNDLGKVNVWMAQQQLFLNVPKGEDIKAVTLFDLNGRLLKVWNNTTSWPVSLNLMPSVYIINVMTNKQISNHKIVIR